MDPANFTSSFGPRVHPVHGGASNHTGIDMAAAGGTPILASSDGVVTSAGDAGAYGNQVILDHGSAKSTMYGHMQGFNVEPGQTVKKGDVIGYVGTTGLSTGNHLHWETWENGTPVNPMTFLGGS